MGSSERDARELLMWLESTDESATIRVYKSGDADKLEALEAPLFARFGFHPIARQDYVETRIGYLFNPFQVRAVCYAR